MTARYTLELDTAPATEPVTAAEAKAHLHIDTADHDTWIAANIQAAREQFESDTDTVLITQTWLLKLDAFPSTIWLPKPPVVSVTSVKYYDTDGNQQTFNAANYILDAPYFCPGSIVLAYNTSWPEVRPIINTIIVEYVAGYGAAAAVPESIKTAIKMLVGHWFEHREAAGDGQAHKAPLAYDSIVHANSLKGLV